MADLLGQANAWLTGQRQQHLSRSVTYLREGQTYQCSAVVTRTVFEAQTEMGVLERWESRDYVFARVDFPLDEPRRGDAIVESVGGVDYSYEATAPRGAPVWQWVDNTNTALRVHTKLKSQGNVLPVLYPLYHGAFGQEAISDEEIGTVLAFTMASVRRQTRSIVAADQYIYVVLPTAFGEPTFAVNGLIVSAWEKEVRTLTTALTGPTEYAVYRSAYKFTGAATVSVS